MRTFIPMSIVLGSLALAGCEVAALQKPSAAISLGATYSPDIQDEAEHIDALCSQREQDLAFEYKEGQDAQEEFKTILGSITGGVTTAGSIAAAVAGIVADPDDVAMITGITGFITGGLGTIGTIVTGVYVPGKDKMDGSAGKLAKIEAAKKNARDAAAKASAEGASDADKEAWVKASADLRAECTANQPVQ